jgi:thiol-disulfide isomerase/thioredoxin
MKRKVKITVFLVCLGIGSATYYRMHLMPPAIQFMKDRQVEGLSEYKPLFRGNGEGKLMKFRLTDINGVAFDSSDLKGKIVLLNFWTTWCTACVAEMPALEKLHQKLKDKGVAIVAINIKEPVLRVKNFVADHNLTFITLVDADGDITKNYNVFATPTTLIFGKSGQRIDTVIGSYKWDSKASMTALKRIIDNEIISIKN